MRFTAEVEATGGTTAGFRVPPEVVEALGSGKRPKVVVTINGYSWRSSVAPMGGEHWVGVAAAHRGPAGVEPGTTHELELDTAPRVVEVPPELAQVFTEEPALAEAWGRLSYSHQRRLAEPVAAAKGAERASAASPGSWPSCGADPPDGTPDRSPFALSEPRSTFALARVERGRAADTADERTRKVEPMDLYRTDDSYVAMIDMPGMTPSSIEVDVDGTVMTVRAERARPAEDVRWLVRGRRAGTFVRRFTIGENIDVDAIAADYTDGVLTITLPVAEQAKPRKVEVTTGARPSLAQAA